MVRDTPSYFFLTASVPVGMEISDLKPGCGRRRNKRKAHWLSSSKRQHAIRNSACAMSNAQPY
jgi:hypothetical protein